MPNLQLWDLFHGTQERVRKSRGKRAISVRGIEVLLYNYCVTGPMGVSALILFHL